MQKNYCQTIAENITLLFILNLQKAGKIISVYFSFHIFNGTCKVILILIQGVALGKGCEKST